MTLQRSFFPVLVAVALGVGIAIASSAGSTAAPRTPPAAYQRAPSSVPLFPVTVGGKAGFIDAAGTLAIEPIYDEVVPFGDGLAAVLLGGRWGYVDAAGELVIEPRFESAGFFSEGLAAVREEGERRWGYIDERGGVVVPPRFDTADEFRKGLARVGFETTRSKLLWWIADDGDEIEHRTIDRSGAFVPAPHPTTFASGEPGERIPFEHVGLWGYMDADGNTVIEPRFRHASPFADGLALVWVADGSGDGGAFGYIDGEGQIVIEPRFEWANSFSDGVAGVKLGEEGWGFIDPTGAVALEPRFDWIYGGFRCGLVQVAQDGAFCYVDRKGEQVWPPKR